jgi:hypothetical protein
MISCYDASEIKSDETKNQIAFEKEQKAFFQVLKRETSSFYPRDYVMRENIHSTDYKFDVKNNDDGTFDAEGWQEVDREIEKYIKEHPEVALGFLEMTADSL